MNFDSLSPLATFVTTFFLAESFRFFNRFYCELFYASVTSCTTSILSQCLFLFHLRCSNTGTTRGIQGRLNDISLILASNATRSESDGELTEGAVVALDDIAQIQRLLHLLYWCSVVKRFKCLLSPEGISYLLSKKLISQNEYASLIQVGESRLGGHHASMTWLLSRITLAVKRRDIDADQAAMMSIYDKITNLRMLMARLPDMYDGRMPLAYVHFVNLLVGALIVVRVR